MKALIKFYLSCVLSSWGDRLWAFALSIYFITINEDSLKITAINGLSGSLAKIIFGPLMGSVIDKYQRIKVIRVALLVQNSTVAINCVLVVGILIFKVFTESAWNGVFFYFIQGVIIFLNVISTLASMTTKIAIERDWAIVIAKNAHDNSLIEKDEESETKEDNEKRSKEQLANINATIRRFDLSTAIIAPMFAGGIMSFLRITPRFNGTVLSAMFFATWNVISFFLEYNLLASVYIDVPELKKEIEDKQKQEKNVLIKIKESILGTADGWKAYFNQGIILMPSIALSLLYLTVLSFDSITIGYAKSQRLTEQFISIFQAVGSVSGMLGTVVFQIMHNKLQIFLPYIGIFGCTYQLLFLCVCFASIWLPGSVFVLVNNNSTNALHQECINSNQTFALNLTNNNTHSNQLNKFEAFFFESPCLDYTSILVLLTGMALSRFGLWLSDLVIHQIIQENVEEKQRGIIGGTQNSFNTIFDLVKYVLVIFLSDVTQYGYLVIVSVTAVSSSAILYILYALIEVVSKRFYQATSDEDQTVYDKSMITVVKKNPEKENDFDDDEDNDSFDQVRPEGNYNLK